MEGRLEEFQAALQALIERKIAPLELEIREQSDRIQKLSEQVAALPAGPARPVPGRAAAKGAEEAKANVPATTNSKAPKEAIDSTSAAEQKKLRTEELKKKAEEEKTKKLEQKKKQEEALKKKQEEEKANKDRAKKEAEEKKKAAEEKKKEAEEKKKKEQPGKARPDSSKKPAEETKNPVKKAGGKRLPKPDDEGQSSPPQEQSSDVPPSTEAKVEVSVPEPTEATAEPEVSEQPEVAAGPEIVQEQAITAEAVVPEVVQAENEEPAKSEEPANSGDAEKGKAQEAPAFVEEEAQPSAPENEAEDNSEELRTIEAELKRLRDVRSNQTHGEPTLLKVPPFQLSLGAKSAMSLLNTLDETQLYLNSMPQREETMWVFRLFFQLCGEMLPDDNEEAWDNCKMFLASGKETGMEKKVAEAVQSFNFSDENIDMVEKVLAGKVDKVNPNVYNQFCTLTGLIMFTVKEGVTYSGLIPEKLTPWRKYQRLLHRKQKLMQ